MKPLIAALVVFGLVQAASASPIKYGVTVRADKRTDFSSIRTYVWMAGRPAVNPDVNWDVEAAVDRELGALGLTKVEEGPGDTVVTFMAMRRTDVDLKTHVSPTSDLRRQYPVGVVVVRLLDPRHDRDFFLGYVDMPLHDDAAGRRAQIQAAIVQMFALYPTRKP